MTAAQFATILVQMRLTGDACARIIGVTPRAIDNYKAGRRIPKPVSRLLEAYRRHGIPNDLYDDCDY